MYPSDYPPRAPVSTFVRQNLRRIPHRATHLPDWPTCLGPKPHSATTVRSSSKGLIHGLFTVASSSGPSPLSSSGISLTPRLLALAAFLFCGTISPCLRR